MYPNDKLSRDSLRGAAPPSTQEIVLRSLEGTVQRIDYRKGELTVVAEGRLWRVHVAADCRLWFDGSRVPLRCFQPLNHVSVYYELRDGRHVARGLFGSESGAAPVRLTS